MSAPNPPIADHIGLHYVLKMTNLARPDGMGTPNFLYLVGPFPDRIAACAWGSNPENNRADSPLWQVVALGDFPGHLPLYAPEIAALVDPAPRSETLAHQPAGVPTWPTLYQPPVGYRGPHYVLRINTPIRSSEAELEALLYLIGPFPRDIQASAWASDRTNNPTANSHWHVVALDHRPSLLPIFAPDQAPMPGHEVHAPQSPAPSDYDGDGGTTETLDRLVSGDAGGDDGPATPGPGPGTGPTTPPDAIDSLAASIRQPVATDQPSPGPWAADVFRTDCGAIRILDNRGTTIGWATDTMGHTLDPAATVGIHPNDIGLNAALMALGPDAIMLCRLIRTAFTAYREQMEGLGWPLHAEMETAFDMAGGMLRRTGGLHDGP